MEVIVIENARSTAVGRTTSGALVVLLPCEVTHLTPVIADTLLQLGSAVLTVEETRILRCRLNRALHRIGVLSNLAYVDALLVVRPKKASY